MHHKLLEEETDKYYIQKDLELTEVPISAINTNYSIPINKEKEQLITFVQIFRYFMISTVIFDFWFLTIIFIRLGILLPYVVKKYAPWSGLEYIAVIGALMIVFLGHLLLIIQILKYKICKTWIYIIPHIYFMTMVFIASNIFNNEPFSHFLYGFPTKCDSGKL